MKKILLLLISTALIANGYAQTTTKSPTTKYHVSGIVKNSQTNELLPFATVAVMDSIKPITATYTNDDGTFKVSVPKGKYSIKTTLIGYSPNTTYVTVNGNTVLDTIFLSEGVQADAAVVVGQLVTTDIDKTTYNTAADPETPALTALEMMRKVPMLTVDGDDNLRLNGQTNFKILVNGKSSTMMGSNYKDVLKSMPANSIKNIEVITNPPAKYDAEGVGGIINIITDRRSIDGFNGSVGAGIRRFGSWNANAYIAVASGKFNFSANYFIGKYFAPQSEQIVKRENFFNDNLKYLDKHGYGDQNNFNQGLNIEASYEIDTMNLITFSASGYMGKSNVSGSFDTKYTNINNLPSMAYQNGINSSFGYTSFNASLDYQKTFKKKEETLTASYKFDYTGNPSSNESVIIDILNYMNSSERSDNSAWNAEHTIQVDYFNPINDKHQIEVGGKFIFRPNISDSYHEIMLNDVWVENNLRKNDLNYLQYIGAVYGAYQYKINKFSVKAGFRAEYTLNTGVFKMTQDQSMLNRYFNIIPYLTLGFKPSDKDNIRLGYTQRLSRPSIFDLNPYINDVDPMDVTTGNPNLESEISHTFDITYGRFDGIYNLNVRAAAGILNNAITSIYTTLPNGGLYSRPENIGKEQRYNLSVNGGVRTIKGKLNFNLNLSGGYTIIDANNGSGAHNEGWSYSAFLNINSTPWKNGNVSGYGGFFYNGIGLQSQSVGNYFYGFSVGQWFLNKTLQVTANIQMPFNNTVVWRNSNFSNSFTQSQEFRQSGQIFGLSVRWRFGKSQTSVKKVSRSIDNDDKRSSGTNQGGQTGGGVQ